MATTTTTSDNKTYPGFLPPAPGFTADLNHPSESMFTQIVLACSLPPFFALLLVSIRLYAARKIVGKMFTDDCELHFILIPIDFS